MLRFRWQPRIWHKLAGISLALALPLSLTTYLLVVAKGDAVRSTGNETRGLEYARPLVTLQLDLWAARRITRQVLAGIRPAADLAAAEQRVDRDFAALLALDARMRVDLNTDTADLADRERPVAQAGNWRSSRPDRHAATRTDAVFARTIRDVRTLIGHVGVTSGLVRDPEVVSYRAAVALVEQIPEIVDQVGQLVDGVDAGTADRATAAESHTSIASRATVLSLGADRLQGDLSGLLRSSDPRTDHTLHGTLEVPLYNAYTAVGRLTTFVVLNVVHGDPLRLDRPALARTTDEAYGAMDALWTALVAVERTMLATRMAGDRRTQRVGLAGVGLMLLVAAGLTLALNRRVARDLGIVSRSAAELAAGDLTRRARVRSRDEVGAMSVAFNSMADRLQEMVAEQQRVQELISEERREAQERFRLAFHTAPIGMCLVTMEGRFAQVNRALCEMLGHTEEEMLRLSMTDVMDAPDALDAPDATDDAPDAEAGASHVERRFVHSGGRTLWALVSTALVRREDGEPFYHVTQIQDITQRRVAEEKLAHQAMHDTLTGLPNRALLMDRMHIQLHRRSRRPLTGLLFIDLDGFKAVNDSLGHEAGDHVLREVAGRLTANARPADTVARLGGDEFVVLCGDLADEANVVDIARRLEAAVAQPIVIGGREVFVTASIGIALATGNTTAEELIRDADTAMYHIKATGKNGHAIFAEALRQRTSDRIGAEAALRQGLRDDHFVLHYQPIIDVRTGAPVAAEALIRLQDPERGLLGPGEFIPAAEENGLIVPIGAWVLGAACRQLAGWRAAGEVPPDLHIAVNVSTRQVARPEFVDTVAEALAVSGLEPRALALELTESVVMGADAGTLRRLEQLRELGVQLGIDDFGTGYSSLTYLKRLPATFLKIDRSFVSGVVGDSSDREIVTAVIRLGQAVGLTTIAEGVEDADQLAALGELGCDQAQGYLIGRPQPGPPAVSRRTSPVPAGNR